MADQGVLDALALTQGQAVGDGYDIAFGGACPVQGTGTVDGHEAYYRARGRGWSLEIYAPGVSSDDPKATPIFYYSEAPYAEYEAGWLTADKSCAHIVAAIAVFRAKIAEVTSG